MRLILLAAACSLIALPATAQTKSGDTDSTPPTPAGYQPPPQPPVPPGVPQVYVQAPPADVAYPAPAPLASYPPCKKGQFDKCRQLRDPK